jgi:hypothetical protein
VSAQRLGARRDSQRNTWVFQLVFAVATLPGLFVVTLQTIFLVALVAGDRASLSWIEGWHAILLLALFDAFCVLPCLIILLLQWPWMAIWQRRLTLAIPTAMALVMTTGFILVST